MTCGCNANVSVPESVYHGGKKRTKRRRTRRTRTRCKRKGNKKRSTTRSTNKLYGGNYLTGTIADGAGGSAFGKMTGAQIAGSHIEENSDVMVQRLG